MRRNLLPISAPWRSAERRRLLVGLGLASTMWLVASIGARSTAETGQQVVFGAVGVLAVGAAVVTALGWLTYGRRAVGLRMETLLGQSGTHEPASAPSGAALVAVAGTTRFHRSDCVMVAGKSSEGRHRDEHEAMGRRGCQMCGTADA